MYFLIGISLLFACLYAVNLSASLLTTIAWRVLSPVTARWAPRTRSNLILVLRVLPLTIALIFIAAFMVPAFIRFEPSTSDETVGYKLAAISLVSAFGFAAACYRIFASWWRTKQLIANWVSQSEPAVVSGVTIPAYRLRHPFPVVAVVGVFRPRFFVAEQILEELNEEELAAAIAHEVGHISTRDNFKRMAMRICGDLLVLPLGKALDRVWSEAAEAAADDHAVEMGGPTSALNLASALVKVGQITPPSTAWNLPLAAFLVEAEDASLASRIDRLLQLAETETGVPVARSPLASIMLWFLFAMSGALVVSLAANNAFLLKVHSITEAVLASLQ